MCADMRIGMRIGPSRLPFGRIGGKQVRNLKLSKRLWYWHTTEVTLLDVSCMHDVIREDQQACSLHSSLNLL